jgi:hypothetical protein
MTLMPNPNQLFHVQNIFRVTRHGLWPSLRRFQHFATGSPLLGGPASVARDPATLADPTARFPNWLIPPLGLECSASRDSPASSSFFRTLARLYTSEPLPAQSGTEASHEPRYVWLDPGSRPRLLCSPRRPAYSLWPGVSILRPRLPQRSGMGPPVSTGFAIGNE